MAAVDYTAYAGDTISIVVSIVDEDDAPLTVTGATVTYAISSTVDDASIVTKTVGDGIVIAGDQVTVTVLPADSALLERDLSIYDIWHHEMELTLAGVVSTVLHGDVRFKRTMIA